MDVREDIKEINKEINENKMQLNVLENRKRILQTMCNHKWERHNFVIDGECNVCSICDLKVKVWGCGL